MYKDTLIHLSERKGMISESDREGKRIIIHSTPEPFLQCFPHVKK